MPEASPAVAPGSWLGANRRVVVFLLSFGLWIGLFSLLFQFEWTDRFAVVPMTEATARVSNVFIRGLGFDSQVSGTTITGPGAPGINILKGCNGAYVMAIYLSAVFAFPSSLREKAIGAAIGIPAVVIINIARIVSLFYIQAERPDLFESFHYHVWQTLVIVLAMAVWIAWAEIVVKVPRR